MGPTCNGWGGKKEKGRKRQDMKGKAEVGNKEQGKGRRKLRRPLISFDPIGP